MAKLIAVDVGTVRIGVAVADSIVPIAMPYATVSVDGEEIERIKNLVSSENIETIVVGYPRNQAGDTTEQTGIVEAFAHKLQDVANMVFQDESLTSVLAEERLKSLGKPYEKADIDAMAAAIILQDYLETHHAV